MAGVVFLEATAPDDVGSIRRHVTPFQRALSKLTDIFAKADPNGEVEHEKKAVEEIRAAPNFPAMPVIALSDFKKPPRWMMSSQALAERERNQIALAAISPLGERVLAHSSGDFLQMTEPDAVLGAIRKVAERFRATA